MFINSLKIKFLNILNTINFKEIFKNYLFLYNYNLKLRYYYFLKYQVILQGLKNNLKFIDFLVNFKNTIFNYFCNLN